MAFLIPLLAAGAGIASGLSSRGRETGGAPQDPYALLQALYQRAIGGDAQAAQLMQQLQGQGSTQQDRFNNFSNYLEGDYANPNTYSDEEQNRFTRQGEMENLLPTADQLGSLGLSPEEIQRIIGNPGAGTNYFNDAASAIPQTQELASQRTFDTLGEQGNNLRRGGENAQQQGYGTLSEGSGRIREGLGDTEQGVGGLLNDSSGRIRSGISQNSQGIGSLINNASGEAAGVYNNPNLKLSSDFSNNYNFGDKDMQGLEYLANRSVGSKYEQLLNDTRRRAAAAGSVNPLAVPALAKEFQSSSAADAGDAAVSARLQGRGEQLNRMQGLESMRLGAEQNQAGLALPAILNILNQGVGSRLALGQQSTNAEQGLLNSGLQSRLALGQQRLGAEQGLMNSGLSLNEFLSQLQSGNEKYLGSSQLDSINRLNEQSQANNRFIADTGAQYAQQGENTEAQRQAALAANRQGTDRSNMEYRFNTGLAASDRLSNRYGTIAQQRIDEENKKRAYQAQQQQQAQSAGQQNTSNMLNLWGAQQNAGQNAANAYTNYSAARAGMPTALERGLSTGLGVLSGATSAYGGITNPGGRRTPNTGDP